MSILLIFFTIFVSRWCSTSAFNYFSKYHFSSTTSKSPLRSAILSDLDKYENVISTTGGKFVDENELLSKSTFAIKPSDLILLTKKVLVHRVGLDDETLLANDFEFCAPFVGPLNREEYLNALRSFNLNDAFPDMDNRFHFIRVDPFQTNRVWWHSRALATHTGPLVGKPATGVKLELPPQANSFIFNEQGQVKEVTIGYVLDRRVGNTGGLGGAFGYLYGTGNPLPIPECRPYKKSWQFRIFTTVGNLAQKLQKLKAKK